MNKTLQHENELDYILVTNAAATAEIYYHGAHLTRWQPRGERPVLWLSQHSNFAPEKPIRGGVPICFPWFGTRQNSPDSPPHGFARVMPWKLESLTDNEEITELQWLLSHDESTCKLWPHRFEANFTVQIGAQLSMNLEVRNVDEKPFTFEAALHSYFAVGDAREIEIHGLENLPFFDKVKNEARRETGPIRITEETDRVYNGTQSTCRLIDKNWQREIEIEKTGSNTTVVWNPWIEKARAMNDFGDDEWPQMVCIETANAGSDAITLAPGESHAMSATIRVKK